MKGGGGGGDGPNVPVSRFWVIFFRERGVSIFGSRQDLPDFDFFLDCIYDNDISDNQLKSDVPLNPSDCNGQCLYAEFAT